MKKILAIKIPCIIMLLLCCCQNGMELTDEAIREYNIGNYEKAFELYTKAAKKGDFHYAKWSHNYRADIYFGLAECYYNGKGVSQNYSKAFDCYQTAAVKYGSREAQYKLGLCYFYGQGVSNDCLKATECFEKSAKQGEMNAELKLAECYEKGIGVSKNIEKAKEWHQKAANQGSFEAKNKLNAFIFQSPGVLWFRARGLLATQKYAEAIELFEYLANQGNDLAQYQLGSMYANGKGVSQNYYKAVEWYQKAAYQ